MGEVEDSRRCLDQGRLVHGLPARSMGDLRAARSRAPDVRERDLIRRCREGDREAQGALYEEHAPKLYRLALRLMGDADEAAEVIQDTFVQALLHLDDFRGASRVATWLHRITVNQALQRLRQRRRTSEKLSAIKVLPTGADSLSSAELRMDVEAALADLPPEERAIILLRAQQGLGYAQIAEVVGIPPGTVASRLNRARARLRQRLGEAI